MKCILCEKRKGKRFCPAKNTHICSQCCGEKRVVEIACPADCVYLTSGQSYQSFKKYVTQLQQQEDPLRRKKLYETSQNFSSLFFEIEEQIIHFAGELRSFTDEHILEATGLLQETYKTEEKGLIYEHTSPNPLVQALFRELRKLLEEKRSQVTDDSPLLRRVDIVDCLEVVETDIRYHLENQSDRGSYLNFILRNHPKSSSQRPKESLIRSS